MSLSVPWTRRSVLLGGVALTGAAAGIAMLGSRNFRGGALFLSAQDDAEGRHYISAFDLERGLRFALPVGQRCHQAVRDPARTGRAIIVARRPGTALYDVDLDRGHLVNEVSSPVDRHFYGHAVFSADGAYLLVAENDFAAERGLIGIYGGSDLTRLGEIPSHGIGPHEIRLLSNGSTLVVANGGIRTHPDRAREKLNLDTMEPNLAYVDWKSGVLLGAYRLPDRSAGLRHLDVAEDDTVAIAIQYEGDDDPSHPLLAFHAGEDRLRPAERDERFAGLSGYAASVCLSPGGERALLTCPRGDRVLSVAVETGAIESVVPIRDAGGIALVQGGDFFIITTGGGDVYRVPTAAKVVESGRPAAFEGRRWDNHLLRC